MADTPLHFRLPAEWEPQEAVILTWPHNPRTWPGRLEEARSAHLNLIREIAECQDVWLVVRDIVEEIEITRRLTLACRNDKHIRFFHHPNNDAWIRDYGPITVMDVHGQRTMTDWRFNGWGDKYGESEDYRQDDGIPATIAEKTHVQYCAVPHILEGGSIDVNGCGTLLTSSSCLLNANRNPGLTRGQIGDILEKQLGAHKIIWIGEGIKGDDTDGHIDDTARFTDTRTVVCAWEKNTDDPNHAPLHAAYETLRTAADQDGHPLNVVKLPMPEPVYYKDERLPASYANFLITNEKVLAPIFGCKRDETATGILRELFPRRTVVGINARDLVIGYGSIHCLSQNIPAGYP